MIPKYVTRSKVFGEFSPDERETFFDLTEKKVLAHLDNLYYTVFIHGDKPSIAEEVKDKVGFSDSSLIEEPEPSYQTEIEEVPVRVERLIDKLEELHEQKSGAYDQQIVFQDLDYYHSNHAIYKHRLSCQENYDIFIASYLPNDDTPRIEVQIRTRSLVLLGIDEALRTSFEKVVQILRSYDLKVVTTRENRLDYAFHTNIIQNPIEYFSDDDLLDHTVSTMRNGQKVFDLGKEIDLSYFALGNRKSNNVFFRAYNKSREVVEMGYKSFFLDRWLENGLISRYDYDVYCSAYESKSYTVGLLVGRIKWYLGHGRDLALKRDLEKLLKSCYEKNSNSDEIRKKIKGVLPEVTLICNIEFETKRKFYASWEGVYDSTAVPEDSPAALSRIYQILERRALFLDYLTSKTVRFVKDRNVKESDYADWWKRIRSATSCDYKQGEYKRIYRRKPDMKRAARRLSGDVAFLSMLINESVEERPFVEDLSDVLSNLNDNSFRVSAVNPLTGELFDIHDPAGYQALRSRRGHQNRKIIEDMHKMLQAQRDEQEAENERIRKYLQEHRDRWRYEEDLYHDDPDALAHRQKFEPAETDADLIAAGARDPDKFEIEEAGTDSGGIWKKKLMAQIKRDRKNK